MCCPIEGHRRFYESNRPLLPSVSVSFSQPAFIFYILPEKQQSPFIYLLFYLLYCCWFCCSKEIIQESDNLSDFGVPSWRLGVALLVAWILVFFCMLEGIHSTGKVRTKTHSGTGPRSRIQVCIALWLKTLTFDFEDLCSGLITSFFFKFEFEFLV
jgi:hypothetical protein